MTKGALVAQRPLRSSPYVRKMRRTDARVVPIDLIGSKLSILILIGRIFAPTEEVLPIFSVHKIYAATTPPFEFKFRCNRSTMALLPVRLRQGLVAITHQMSTSSPPVSPKEWVDVLLESRNLRWTSIVRND